MTIRQPRYTPADGLRPMAMLLDWVANVQFAGPCWALAYGLYRKAGIDMTLVPWVEDGRGIVEKALMRDVPVLASSEDNLIIEAAAQDKGSIAALAAMFQTTPLILMSPPQAPIQQITDLKGKRVAIHCDGLHVLESLLALHGVLQHEVEITELANDLGNLTSGRFDAVQGYALCEPLEHAAQGLVPATLRLRHAALHPYAQVMFAPIKDLDAEPALYRAALDATFEGWRAAFNDPERAAAAIAAVGSPMLDEGQEARALAMACQLVQGEGGDGIAGLGRIDPARWAANIRAYASTGRIAENTSTTCGLRLDIWPGSEELESVQ